MYTTIRVPNLNNNYKVEKNRSNSIPWWPTWFYVGIRNDVIKRRIGRYIFDFFSSQYIPNII